MQGAECFACGRKLPKAKAPKEAFTADGQMVWVGPDCARLIARIGGYQPPLGGPRLFNKRDET